jgi:hypothetical protein
MFQNSISDVTSTVSIQSIVVGESACLPQVQKQGNSKSNNFFIEISVLSLLNNFRTVDCIIE